MKPLNSPLNVSKHDAKRLGLWPAHLACKKIQGVRKAIIRNYMKKVEYMSQFSPPKAVICRST